MDIKYPITIDQVDRSYVGKIGCMCGCLGKYTSPSESSRSVKIALKKINEAMVNNDPKLTVDPNGQYACLDYGNERRTAVYLKTQS